jgi:hypothetical protein
MGVGAGRTRTRTAVFALLAAAAAAPAVADDASAAWYMDGANAGRTSYVDVEPVRSAPAVLWRRKPDEGVICEPVTWNGVLFTLSKVKSGTQILSAFDLRNGLLLARTVRLKRTGGWAHLGVWRDIVVVVEPDQTEAYTWKDNGLTSKWSSDGSAVSPCVLNGVALVGTISFETSTGRRLAIASEIATRASGRLGCISAGSAPGDSALLYGVLLGQHDQYPGTWLRGQTCRVVRISGGADTMRAEARAESVPLAKLSIPSDVQFDEVTAVRVDAPGPGEPGAWIIDPGQAVSSASGASGALVLAVDKGVIQVLPAAVRPAVTGGLAYTFDKEGDLIAVRANGAYETVASAAELPPGTSRGRLSAARGVLCAPDWAFDLASRHVLWTREFAGADAPVASAIPAGPGLLAVRTGAGEIVCLADPQRPQKAGSAAPAAARAPPSAAKTPAPALPVAADGVLLRDGRQIFGQTQLHGVEGGVTVVAADGTVQRFDRDDVLVAESGGKVLFSGSETEVHRVWDAALRAVVVPRLESVAVDASERGLRTLGMGWIERARRWGLPEARVAELTRKLPNSDALQLDAKIRGFEKRCGPILDACSADVVRAAEWCGARGFLVAGAVLASRSASFDRPLPGADAAAKLIPASFRTCLANRISGERWVQWARALLAAEASVVEPDDPAWQRVSREWWAPDKGLAFRTRDLLFFSRSTDPAVVGPCLSRGQAAVRGLHQLLGVADPVRPAGDDERLIVLLHEKRTDYLTEAAARGAAIAGTAGYFSPAENVSRFFVPDAGAAADGEVDLGRGLFKVLAHELTHHYIEARWAPRLGPPDAVDRSRQPGFWVVEGIAQFMGDQIVDSDTRGLTFEDPGVLSVSLCARLDTKGRLPAFRSFVDLDQAGFAALGELQDVTASDRRIDRVFKLSEKNVFYEQSATLAFFMHNARGEEGRRALVEYLRRYYLRRQTRESWKVLGFETADELETAFSAWLRALK